MSLLPGPFGEATARLERRFLTTAVIPTIVFVVVTGAIILVAFDAVRPASRAWSDLSISSQLLVTLAAAALIWFVSGLIASNWRKIVRLYEGYPFARLYRKRARDKHYDLFQFVQRVPGAAYHLRRCRAGSSARTAYRRYPPAEYEHEVLPTSLGNILLAAERYGLHRYGVDTTLLWPRLYWQLPPDMRTDLEAFKEEHQLPIALSFMAAWSTLIASLAVLVAGSSWQLFVLVSTVGLALSMGAYLLALERAEEYGEQLRTAVDLHHGALKGVWDQPEDDEREFFQRVQFFVEHGAYLETTQQQTTSTTEPEADVAGGELPALTKWKATLLNHVRLSVVACVVGALLIGIGAAWLKLHEVGVVVARTGTAQFTSPTTVALVHMPPRQVPRGSFSNVRAVKDRISVEALAAGTPITSHNSIAAAPSASSDVIVDLPVFPSGRVPGDLAIGDRVTAQFQRCGVTVRDVRLLALTQPSADNRPAKVTVSVPARVSAALGSCGGSRVALIRP